MYVPIFSGDSSDLTQARKQITQHFVHFAKRFGRVRLQPHQPSRQIIPTGFVEVSPRGHFARFLRLGGQEMVKTPKLNHFVETIPVPTWRSMWRGSYTGGTTASKFVYIDVL